MEKAKIVFKGTSSSQLAGLKLAGGFAVVAELQLANASLTDCSLSGLADMGKGMWTQGKGFAKVGALYAGTECIIEGVSTLRPAVFPLVLVADTYSPHPDHACRPAACTHLFLITHPAARRSTCNPASPSPHTTHYIDHARNAHRHRHRYRCATHSVNAPHHLSAVLAPRAYITSRHAQYRAKNDIWNAVYGGLVSGAVLGRNSGIKAMIFGGLGFAAFSGAIDLYMRKDKPDEDA